MAAFTIALASIVGFPGATSGVPDASLAMTPGGLGPPDEHCLRVVTSAAEGAAGEIELKVGGVAIASGMFEEGSVVTTECFASINEVILKPTSEDAWVGTIEHSRDGGKTWAAMSCTDCNGDTAARTLSLTVVADVRSHSNQPPLYISRPTARRLARSTRASCAPPSSLTGAMTVSEFLGSSLPHVALRV
eukprot:CAMPEP_0115857840 /NCGR_PEP_ID=MMETSP0287-20121206/15785_1 /TAXON_ID=412157 /ORGANISM="Chrysochromulina rotalis, Strain UIO044" /LENGTH=189 /DNA_ID=CAMNT_0003312077 /DNA_START=610 /DNA_END=1176 /DNA_ORIENTATION=-